MKSIAIAKQPPQPLFSSIEAQIEQHNIDETDVRAFLEEHQLMTIPDWLQKFTLMPLPPHMAPLAYLGVPDDLTSESRLDEVAVHYIHPRRVRTWGFLAARWPWIQDRLSFTKVFQVITTRWHFPGNTQNPVRRRYIDSGANEGIGFYVEELLHQYGLFDDRPQTRVMIYRYMRLRALRVEVDVQLALGNFDIEQAGDYLAKTVPMDRHTAVEEAGFFAYNPGQAMTYQIGKNQIFQFLSDAKIQMAESFSLRDFHDFLMLNGNVPIALLRWEYLGDNSEIMKMNDVFSKK